MHVPRSLRDFSPNHFVPMLQKVEHMPVVIELNSRPDRSFIKLSPECRKDQSNTSFSSEAGVSTDAYPIFQIHTDITELKSTSPTLSVSDSITENSHFSPPGKFSFSSEAGVSADDSPPSETGITELKSLFQSLIFSESGTENSHLTNMADLFSESSNLDSVKTFDSRTSGSLNGVFWTCRRSCAF